MRTALPCSCRILLGLALVFSAPWAAAADAVPTVRIDTGALSGVHDARAGLDEFKGIPYAAAPLGALRWKPPQPVAAWQGVRAAGHFGPRCMQRPLFGDMVFRSAGMSEDCLYLNVWTPAHARGGKLPVLVYFYGGGFVGGDGSELRYDGASLARRGIVTVTVNYRLGPLGFLHLEPFGGEAWAGTANLGLADQTLALRWVREHAEAFGGDPARVTIFGESAGAMSVATHLARPSASGLFHRAIAQSGAATHCRDGDVAEDAPQHAHPRLLVRRHGLDEPQVRASTVHARGSASDEPPGEQRARDDLRGPQRPAPSSHAIPSLRGPATPPPTACPIRP